MMLSNNQTTTTIVSPVYHHESTAVRSPICTGFIFLIGSSFLYGSNYVPVKHFETGDGMFFQFVLSIGIWLVGFVVYWLRCFPKFYALPMLGGFFCASGNLNSVPIIKTIGLALGMLIWNVVGLVTGWATARFGCFGLEKDIPSNVVLNYIGVAVAAISTFFYLFVKSETSRKVQPPPPSPPSLPSPSLPIDQSSKKVRPDSSMSSTSMSKPIHQPGSLSLSSSEIDECQMDECFLERQNQLTKRVIGSSLAIFTGVMYGQYNTPVQYTHQHYNKGGNYLDMQFSFSTGILITSLSYFIIYCIVRKNNPRVYPKAILPGLISGIMWGAGSVCFFKATDVLNQAITFPISNSAPPIFSSLWSILLYKEIKGARNLLFLSIGFLIAITGSILIGLSF